MILRTAPSMIVALVLLTLPSCARPRNTTIVAVHGTITYKGMPVTAGTISFHGPNGRGSYSQPIDREGKYTVWDLPGGETVVTIETESANPNRPKPKKPTYPGDTEAMLETQQKQMNEMRAPRGNDESPFRGPYVQIPAKYTDERTSPLKVNLRKGTQKLDFNLTD